MRTIGSGIMGSSAGQLKGPTGLALWAPGDGTGEQALLFVADRGNHRVQVFNADTGHHVRFIGTGVVGSGPDQFYRPNCLVVHEPPLGSSQSPLLFVADSDNHRVQVFDVGTGKYVSTLGAGVVGSVVGQLNRPAGVAVHRNVDGGMVVFVSEYQNHRVQQFFLSSMSSLLDSWKKRDVNFFGSLESLQHPYDIVLKSSSVEGESTLYVADTWNHRIQVYNTQTGALLRSLGTGTLGCLEGQLNSPTGMFLRRPVPGSWQTNLLYVAEFSNHRVQVLKLYFLACVFCFASKFNLLFHFKQVFDADTGSHVRFIGEGIAGSVEALKGPYGLTLREAPPGSKRPSLLYVADCGNHRVQVCFK